MAFNATEDPYEEDEYFVSDADGAATNEAEDEDEDVTIHFSVSVSRGDGHEGLEFSCATDGETVEVRNVRYEAIGGGGGGEADEDDEDEYFSSYPGPNYDELDESVQEEFHKYLEARGIDATLANYIAEAHVDKEQREYTRWLETSPTSSRIRGWRSAPERGGRGARVRWRDRTRDRNHGDVLSRASRTIFSSVLRYVQLYYVLRLTAECTTGLRSGLHTTRAAPRRSSQKSGNTAFPGVSCLFSFCPPAARGSS